MTPRALDCDCRQKSARNVRIAAVAVMACAYLVRLVAFRHHAVGFPACSFAIGLAILTYGIATLFDENATFPKWAYAAIALLGAVLAFVWAARLF